MKHQPISAAIAEVGLGADRVRSRLAVSRWASRIPWLFTIVVAIPTILTAIYYLAIAAPIYVSEAQFVASVKNQSPTSGGLGSLLTSVGAGAGQEQVSAYEVRGYMLSRSAIMDLAHSAGLLTVVDRPEGDFIYRFPQPWQRPTVENLFKAYPRFVTVDYDMQTGISTLKVRAFRAGDAQHLAQVLLARSEAWVSGLNDRSLRDAVAQAQRQVDEAQASLVAAQAALTTYRNAEGLIDPDKAAVANLELQSRLETQVAMVRAQRAALAASAPESPQLPVLDRQIAALGVELQAEQDHTAGEGNSLAPKVATFERLSLQRDLAAKTLESAVAGQQEAMLDARRQQLFLDRVVNPSLPDAAEEPSRVEDIFLVFVSCLVGYGILALVIAGVREHRQE